MRRFFLSLILLAPASAQTTLVTVDSYGTLTTPAVVTEPGVVSGIYSSGITTMGSVTQTCLITFTGGGGFGATALVALTGTNVITGPSKLQITNNGQGYTSAPSTGTVAPGGSSPATSCSGSPSLSTSLASISTRNNLVTRMGCFTTQAN